MGKLPLEHLRLAASVCCLRAFDLSISACLDGYLGAVIHGSAVDLGISFGGSGAAGRRFSPNLRHTGRTAVNLNSMPLLCYVFTFLCCLLIAWLCLCFAFFASLSPCFAISLLGLLLAIPLVGNVLSGP